MISHHALLLRQGRRPFPAWLFWFIVVVKLATIGLLTLQLFASLAK